MTYARYQVGCAVERLRELFGARSIYDGDPLREIRRDIMTVSTHTAASRQAAMAPCGQMPLGAHAGGHSALNGFFASDATGAVNSARSG